MIIVLVSTSVVFLTVPCFRQSEVWLPDIISQVTGLVLYIFKLTDGQTVR